MALLDVQSAGEGELRSHDTPSRLTVRVEARLVQRVARERMRQAKRYGLQPEVRQDILRTAHRDMLHGETVKERMQAARTLLMADALDAKRDRDAAQERPGDADAHAALAHAFRAGLETPAARAAFLDLGNAILDGVSFQTRQDALGRPIYPPSRALPAPQPPAASGPAGPVNPS
jgi:hypothetical protein